MEFETFQVQPCKNGIYIKGIATLNRNFVAKTSEEAIEIIRTLLPEDSAKETMGG